MSEEENMEITDKFGVMNILEDSELPKKIPIITVLADHGCIIATSASISTTLTSATIILSTISNPQPVKQQARKSAQPVKQQQPKIYDYFRKH